MCVCETTDTTNCYSIEVSNFSLSRKSLNKPRPEIMQRLSALHYLQKCLVRSRNCMRLSRVHQVGSIQMSLNMGDNFIQSRFRGLYYWSKDRDCKCSFINARRAERKKEDKNIQQNLIKTKHKQQTGRTITSQ